jgi:hypothetical protein
MAMERYELHGVKVYQLNICEAIGDRHLCPGINSLSAALWTWVPSPATVPVIRSLRTKCRSKSRTTGG